MKYAQKILRPRLPQEAREKLNSGGRHKDKKSDLKRQPKHRKKEK